MPCITAWKPELDQNGAAGRSNTGDLGWPPANCTDWVSDGHGAGLQF